MIDVSVCPNCFERDREDRELGEDEEQVGEALSTWSVARPK